MMNDKLNDKSALPPRPRRGRRYVAVSDSAGLSQKLTGTKEHQLNVELQSSGEDLHFHDLLQSHEVLTALHEYERTKERRDSVSRKLCGGSCYVTQADLARLDGELSTATASLAELAKQAPLLTRHTTLAAVATHI